MTAYAMYGDKEMFRGMDISKPITIEEFYSIVDKWV
jgi:hypothetical protein